MKKHILIGWKTQGIGAYLVNYGGDIEYQHMIVKTVNILQLPKMLPSVKNVVV